MVLQRSWVSVFGNDLLAGAALDRPLPHPHYPVGGLKTNLLPSGNRLSLCVPTSLHPEITIFASKHGKHILCEKPIALTLEAADKNNVKLALGFMRRHSPILPPVKTWL